MPPQTPRTKSTRSGSHLTPSFTFGLGLLPSFKFASPRNLSLLSSLSPQRFFNRLAKGKDDLELPETNEPPVEHIATRLVDLFGLFSPENHRDALIDDISTQQSKFDVDSTADLICTGESVDLWSLANDTNSHGMTMNLTSIHEDSVSKGADILISPGELFLADPAELTTTEAPKLDSSPIEDSNTCVLASRKRKHSEAESPSETLAAQIQSIASPATMDTYRGDSSKLWTPKLDEALEACFEKYLAYKDAHSGNGLVFKHTTQNKVLIRMLLNKTGVHRTSKQISSRLLRLNKSRQGSQCAAENLSLPKVDTMEPSVVGPTILSSPIAIPHLQSSPTESPLLTLEKFTMCFVYKLPILGVHDFSKLAVADQNGLTVSSTMALKKYLQISNSAMLADFDEVVDSLVAQSVPVHLITSQINFNSNEEFTSTPASPLTNPRSFSIENGKFQSYLNMRLAPKVTREEFVSWTSSISIYKEDHKVLFRSKELVNGFKSHDGGIHLEVPFLNNFWAGYLTFLSNGLNSFEDLRTLTIVQIIHDGEDAKQGSIHGYFAYRFEMAKMNQGNTNVSFIRVDSGAELEIDDNATLPASSTPPKRLSAVRVSLSVDTSLANGISTPCPSIPSYNASLLHKFNPNYGQSKTNLASLPQSASSAFPSQNQLHTSPTMMNTPASLCTNGRHQSAGQIMNFETPAAITMQNNPNMMYPQHMEHVNAIPTQAAFQHPHPLAPETSQFPHEFSPTNHMGPINNNAGMNPQMRFDPNNSVYAPHAPAHAPMLGGPVPPSQWAMMSNHQAVFAQPPINSAPASQVQFFPKNVSSFPVETKSAKPGNTIKFEPIIEYDPSKDTKEYIKKKKTRVNYHRFLLNPEVIFKPPKM